MKKSFEKCKEFLRTSNRDRWEVARTSRKQKQDDRALKQRTSFSGINKTKNSRKIQGQATKGIQQPEID
jgi:hypothetical protein